MTLQRMLAHRGSALALGACLLTATAGAQAAATAGAFTNAILTVSGPTLPDLSYTMDTDSVSFHDFAGVAESVADAAPFSSAVTAGGTTLVADLIADAFTGADAPPVADASADAFTSAFVAISNDTAAPVDIDVLLEHAFDHFASVDSTASEDAFAMTTLELRATPPACSPTPLARPTPCSARRWTS